MLPIEIAAMHGKSEMVELQDVLLILSNAWLIKHLNEHLILQTQSRCKLRQGAGKQVPELLFWVDFKASSWASRKARRAAGK